MNCPVCGAPCSEGQARCMCCGTVLTADAQAADQRQTCNNYATARGGSSNDAPFDICNGQHEYIPQPVQMNNPDSTLAMVLGIISVVATLLGCVCGCLGGFPALICGIVGLVLSIRCRSVAAASCCTDKKATVGLVTSIIGICLCVLSCVGSIIFVGLGAFEDLFAQL